jgi:hypothetical protein
MQTFADIAKALNRSTIYRYGLRSRFALRTGIKAELLDLRETVK